MIATQSIKMNWIGIGGSNNLSYRHSSRGVCQPVARKRDDVFDLHVNLLGVVVVVVVVKD